MTDQATAADPTTTPSDALLKGRLTALFPAIRKSMYTSVLSITVFSALLFRFSPIGLTIWLALRLVVSVGCVVALDRLERSRRSLDDKLRWLTVLVGVSGVVWGAIPAFVRPDEPEWRAVVVLWLFGNQSVVTAVGSPARTVFLAAIGSVTLVGTAAIGIGGDSFGLVLATLLLLGGAYSIAIFSSLHRTVAAAIESGWAASRLAEKLAARQSELESTNEALADIASHDGLTRLLNRWALTERLTGGSEAETLSGAGWIGFVDVDFFKQVNDSHGHRAGDEVLISLARRWTSLLGDDAVLARAGGDEFILALPPGSEGRAEEIARRLLTAVADPVSTNAGAIRVSCSIGLTEYRDGEPLATALARADEALYKVKAQGRGTWAIAPWSNEVAPPNTTERRRSKPPQPAGPGGSIAADVAGTGTVADHGVI